MGNPRKLEDRDRGPDNLLEDEDERCSEDLSRRSFVGPRTLLPVGAMLATVMPPWDREAHQFGFFPVHCAPSISRLASIAPVQLTDQTTRPTELMTAKVRAALVPASTTPERCHGGPLRWEGSPRVGRRARGRRTEGRAAPARTLTTRPGRAAEASILESRKPGRQRHRFWRAAPCVNSSAMDYAQAPRG